MERAGKPVLRAGHCATYCCKTGRGRERGLNGDFWRERSNAKDNRALVTASADLLVIVKSLLSNMQKIVQPATEMTSQSQAAQRIWQKSCRTCMFCVVCDAFDNTAYHVVANKCIREDAGAVPPSPPPFPFLPT